jgi:hypothetical protein
MIPGTGPGRGVPWWRATMLAVELWRRPGTEGREYLGEPREGRLVKRIKGRHDW